MKCSAPMHEYQLNKCTVTTNNTRYNNQDETFTTANGIQLNNNMHNYQIQQQDLGHNTGILNLIACTLTYNMYSPHLNAIYKAIITLAAKHLK